MQKLRDAGLSSEDLICGRLLARQAARNGDRPYLLFGDQRITYGELDRVTDRLANGLLDAGVAPGAHVALILGNGPEILLLHYALGKIGAIVCPVNTGAKGELLLHYLGHSDSSVAVVGTASWASFAAVAGKAPRVRIVVRVQEPATDGDPAQAELPAAISCVPYEALHRGADRRPGCAVSHSDPAGIFYTSGTTGPSKGIVATHAQSFAFALGRVEYFGYAPEDVLYTCLPLFHTSAMYHAAIAALIADAQVAVSRRFSVSGFWPEVRRYRATQFNLLGSMANMLWGRAPGADDRDHSVRMCGMAPIPSFGPEFERRFGVQIVTSYGLTEFGQGTILQPGYPAEKFHSVGKPRPGVEVQVRDDDGRIAPADVAGEICLRSADPALGGRRYYKNDQANADAWRDGWFHTGDRGYFDAEGYLYFTDRKKDAIRRRGENISAWEVERLIAAHPAVANVAVVGVKAEMLEEEVLACVVRRPSESLDEAELIRYCEDAMPKWMIPRFVEFMQDLPATKTQKVEKEKLRASAENRLNGIWDRERARSAQVR